MLELNWKTILEESVKSYNENELAFLALQGKIELQLRDKIAWYLEQQLKGAGYVKKEYKRCDMAILNKEDLTPIALVEFKVAIWGEFQKEEYEKYCKDDCGKMRKIANGEDIPMYYVFFQIYHDAEKSNLDNQLINYTSAIRSELKIREGRLEPSERIADWGDVSVYSNNANHIEVFKQNIGEYYGVKVGIVTMILKVSPNEKS